jgi:hypothetical protein
VVEVKMGQKFGKFTLIGIVPVEPADEDTQHFFHVVCTSCGHDGLIKTLYQNGDFQQACRVCKVKTDRQAEAARRKKSLEARIQRWEKLLREGRIQGPCQELAIMLRPHGIKPQKKMFKGRRSESYSKQQFEAAWKKAGTR